MLGTNTNFQQKHQNLNFSGLALIHCEICIQIQNTKLKSIKKSNKIVEKGQCLKLTDTVLPVNATRSPLALTKFYLIFLQDSACTSTARTTQTECKDILITSFRLK